MAKLINLRQARKTCARNEHRAQGAENAARFGRSKAERRAEAEEATRLARHLDQHRLEGGQSDD